MNSKILLILICGLLLVTTWAQASDDRGCSPTGVWFSGGYVLTITPTGQDEFSVQYDQVYDVAEGGYKAWTTWPGQLVKTGRNGYRVLAIAMLTSTSDIIELDAIRGWLQFAGCKNITVTYDFFGAYFDPSKEPFVDPPDVNYLPPGGIVENYRRMQNRCPACSLPNAGTLEPRHRH